MKKYLYLTKPDWQHAWIHGGEIPINSASTYFSEVRGGTMTPDENLIHDSPIDLTQYPGVWIDPASDVKNFTFTNCSWNGVPLPELRNASRYREDGAILSFCDELNAETMRRFGKACCVQILDVHLLKSTIDRQLGLIGKMGPCKYTHDHQRNHFLKSHEDSWQKEYRMFWKGVATCSVILPPNIAKIVEVL